MGISPAGETPTSPFRNLTERAGEDIGPYGAKESGGKPPPYMAGGSGTRPYGEKRNLPGGRRRKTKFSTKFFAKLSYKKAGRRPVRTAPRCGSTQGILLTCGPRSTCA